MNISGATKYVDISSVGEGIVLEPPSVISLAEAPSRAKRLVQTGDTVHSTVRPNRRSMFFVSGPAPDLVVSTGFAVLRPKPGLIEPRYLYACIFDKAFTNYLISREKGAAYPAVLPEDVADATINLPPLPEQRAIAHIFGTLDDKIELNRKQNETLEAMARALFKAWFVDFEPVRAKLEGRWQRGQSLPGLPAHLYDLFPDRLVDSELGELPLGWEVKQVGDIGTIICGKTPPTKNPEYYGNDIPFITIPEMHGKIFATDIKRKLSYKGVEFQSKKTLPPGSICVSCIATPGLVVITTKPSQTNQQINSVILHQGNEIYFWYWTLKNLGEAIKAGGSGGSVLANLSTGRFSELLINASTELLRTAYHESVEHFFLQILENERESRTLAQLRDTLLPKLISGELRVPDVERFLEKTL